MRKATIVRVLTGSLIALSAGIVLLSCAVLEVIYDHRRESWGSIVVAFRSGAVDIAAVVIAAFAVGAVGAAALLYVIAWIGAIMNAVRLPDPDWFLVVLLTGILGLGLVGMIAYSVAAPDAPAGPAGPGGDVEQVRPGPDGRAPDRRLPDRQVPDRRVPDRQVPDRQVRGDHVLHDQSPLSRWHHQLHP